MPRRTPRLYHLPDEREVKVPVGRSILEASLEAGVPLTHACGGRARCSTCRVMVLDGLDRCTPRTPEEESLSRHLGFDCAVRLACQTKVAGDVRVRRLVLDCDDEELAREAVQTPAHVSSGEERMLAVLFCDLAGFTAFSERLPPHDVIHTLNRHYRNVARVVERHRGTINNYAGDGFMALFGLAGGPESSFCGDAVRAGLEILGEVERFQDYVLPIYGRGFGARVGIHCGEVVVGSLGAGDSRQLTVIGDTVNFASRLESANKRAGTRLLVSREVKDFLPAGFAIRSVEPMEFSGKTGTFEIFEVS